MTHHRSKTIATWLALALGTFGAHRFYLRGRRDALAWLHAIPTLIGLFGAWRLRVNGIDDWLPWLLLPLLGLMIAQAALCAILYGLTPDEQWAARFHQPVQETAWAPVLGVIFALLIGGGVLMGTIAFSVQHFFEWELASPTALN